MKMRRPHEVPLSRQVLAYLDELFALTGPDGYVFPAFHTSRRPLSENTVNQSFRRMGYAVGEVTAHGLRTTASTLLNESGKWSPDAIERSLAHADANSIRGVYNRGAIGTNASLCTNGGATISTCFARVRPFCRSTDRHELRNTARLVQPNRSQTCSGLWQPGNEADWQPSG